MRLKKYKTRVDGLEMEAVAYKNGDRNAPVLRLTYDSKMRFWKNMGFDAHKWQKKAAKSRARNRVFVAGARGGKSIWSAAEVAPWLLCDNVHGWIVGKTFNLAEKEFRYVHQFLRNHPNAKIRNWVRENANIRYNKDQGRMSITFPDSDSWIECKSIQDPDQLLGEELDFVIFAEGSKIPKYIYDTYIRQRLAMRLGSMILPTTGDGYDDFLVPMLDLGNDPDNHYKGTDSFARSVQSWQFPTIDNPHYPREEHDAAKRDLELGIIDQNTFDEQWGGLIVNKGGRIFKAFDDTIHVVEDYEIPQDWPIIRVIDVGWNHPTCCLWFAVDPEGRLVLIQEYYAAHTEIWQHAQEIQLLDPLGEDGQPLTIELTIIDPASKHRTAASKDSARDQYADHGIYTVLADNDVKAGFARVGEYLRYDLDDETKEFTVPPKLYVFQSCRTVIKEFHTYEFAERRTGEKTDEPKKKNDHGMDCVRYCCMYQPVPHTRMELKKPHPTSMRAMMNELAAEKREIKPLSALMRRKIG